MKLTLKLEICYSKLVLWNSCIYYGLKSDLISNILVVKVNIDSLNQI